MTYVLNLKADDISFVSLLNSVIFTLPYFLFSGSFGQYADFLTVDQQLPKKLKFIELLLISYMIIAILFKNYYLYAVGLFFLGAQATFFGTVKYGMLPEYLKKHELVPGNSAIEGSTFIAITTGMLTGTVIISTFSEYGTYIVSVLLFLLAYMGWRVSLKIPTIHVKGSTGKMNWNIFKTTFQICKNSTMVQGVPISMVLISWFWSTGNLLANQLPPLLSSPTYPVICMLCAS